MPQRKPAPDTLVTHLGRHPARDCGAVNPPVFHASTILFDSIEKMEQSYERRFEPGHVHYGRMGTPTHHALESAVTELESGHAAITFPSGLAAITTTLTGLLASGDHLLVADCVYAPTRRFCQGTLARLGVETTFFDPAAGDGIDALVRERTRAVFLESPGSLTLEVQDLPAIARVARDAGALVMMDNTWATPLFHRPLTLGADIVIHAGTKYLVGHADASVGLVVANEATYRRCREAAIAFGQSAGPDDVHLALRGLRTLAVRLARHQETALRLAQWLARQPEVRRVRYPALPGDPGHALWRRDFHGASGLFSVEIDPVPRPALERMLNRMRLFGLGYSWGGYESLLIPVYPARFRSAAPPSGDGQWLRVHAGLEDADDLLSDLADAFARLRA